MFRKPAFGAAAAVLLLASPASAHHPSGTSAAGGAGPINTISATTLERGASSAAVVMESIWIRAFSDDQLKFFASKHIHAHSVDTILAPTLVYAYGITSDLTAIARLPFVIRRDIREGHHSHGPAGNTVDERGDTAGIGDLTLLAQLRFLNNRATQTEAALLLGLKAPTGKTDLHDAFGERFETEFQPGSGSWDGLLGLALTQRAGPWSFDANVLYQLATEGAQDTNMGDRFLYNLAVSYRLTGSASPASARMSLGGLPEPMDHSGPRRRGQRHHHHEEAPASEGPALDLVLELNGEWHARQEIAGVKDDNSGGNVIYLSPGLRLSYDAWSGFVSVGIPVVNHVNGIQAEPGTRLLAGMALSF